MTIEYFERAANALPKEWSEFHPTIGVVLGSGWSRAVMEGDYVARMEYDRIPGLGASTVQGHAGEVRLMETGGRRAILFCGRHHYYEGAGWGPVVLPVELMRRLGVKSVLLTNAAGAVNPALRPGNLMLIRDHVNTTGLNPLQGPVLPGWGPRFPDQSEVYSRSFATLVRTVAEKSNIALHEGIYAYTAGPCFETPAEIRAYHIWQADAVGMSTVPEAIVANAAGMSVAAISCITNMAAGISPQPLSHAEVMEITAAASEKMGRLLVGLLKSTL